MNTILVLSDTHCWNEHQIPEVIRKLIAQADIVVHCGDYTGERVLEWLSLSAKRFIGVRGNMDGSQITRRLPRQQIFDLDGTKIAVIHPDWGGPPFHPEKLLPYFPKIDLLLFGHTHWPISLKVNDVLCFNPGPGFSSYGLVVIDGSRIEVELKFIK